MLVYVINKNGIPLMPCKPSKARKLLRDGKAKVIRREPFTIKLLWDCTEYVQDLTLIIDSGSRYVGSAVRDNDNRIYYLSQIEIRQDVKSKLDQRRMYRKNRRSRKTRYRKCKVLNRKNSIKKGRYSSTIVSKYNSHIKEINFVAKILPVLNRKMIIETATFDPHALHNPNVLKHPWLYQKGLQFGFYNVKAFILSRDKYICQYCKNKTKDSRLEVHHVVPTSKGGSNRPNNLITLCKTCHDDLHAKKIELKKKNLKNLNLKHATQINVLALLFKKYLDFTETFGYITKTIREYFGITKDHCYDAACAEITKDIIPEFLTDRILYKKCISKGAYQIFHGKRSEKRFPSGKIKGFKAWDKILYKDVKYFIKGRMSSGYAKLCDIFGKEIPLKPIPKFNLMTRLSARKTWIMIEGIIPNS